MLQKIKLPPDEVRFLASLPLGLFNSRLRALWESGWSIKSIADSLNPPSPKSTVHFWIKNAHPLEQRRPIPAPPPKSLTVSAPVANAPRARSISPKVPEDMKARIQELSVLSRRYRAKTAPDSPLALANKELTEIALTLYHRGVPAAEIAKVAGVTYRAMARRIANA